MANAAEKFIRLMQKGNVDTTSNIVDLKVVTTNPLQLKGGDKLVLTKEFIAFDNYIDQTKISVGDVFRAITLNYGQLYYIIDIISSSKNIDKYIQKISYSEDEQQVGYWIDDKPLYSKTIKITLPVITDGTFVEKSTAISVNNYDLVFINKAFAVARAVARISTYPIPYTDDSGRRINIMIDGSNIKISSNSSTFSSRRAYVEIYYTKTTD